MIDRARVLAEDLLLVVRNEWEKARVAGQSFGNYAPQQQQAQSYGAEAAGGDAYAAYYAVSLSVLISTQVAKQKQYAQAGATPAAAGATPAATGDAATDAYAQYAAYWYIFSSSLPRLTILPPCAEYTPLTLFSLQGSTRLRRQRPSV